MHCFELMNTFTFIREYELPYRLISHFFAVLLKEYEICMHFSWVARERSQRYKRFVKEEFIDLEIYYSFGETLNMEILQRRILNYLPILMALRHRIRCVLYFTSYIVGDPNLVQSGLFWNFEN